MGGDELMDRLISYYPMTLRTKRWPTRVILHVLTMNVANAWIEYCERERKKGMKLNQILDVLSFWEEIGQAELSLNTIRGRPSFQSLLNYCPIPEKKRHGPFVLFLIFVMADLIIGLKEPKSNLPAFWYVKAHCWYVVTAEKFQI